MTGRTILGNVRWGVCWGLLFAAALSLFVFILYVIRGAQPFEAQETTLGAVLVMYFLGGLGAGLVIGLLRPLMKWQWGAAIVGGVAAMPAAAVIQVGLAGFESGPVVNVWVTLIVALCLGAPLGWTWWGMS